MSDDIHAGAREQYERDAALIRRGRMSRADLERAVLGRDPRPIYFSPLRNSLVIREGFELEKRAAGERDRHEWTEGIRRRLGLVIEVHRCQVFRGSPEWLWSCLRPGCNAAGYSCPSQAYAFSKADAHARSFMPEPQEDEAAGEMTWTAYMALATGTPVLVAEPLAFGEAW